MHPDASHMTADVSESDRINVTARGQSVLVHGHGTMVVKGAMGSCKTDYTLRGVLHIPNAPASTLLTHKETSTWLTILAQSGLLRLREYNTVILEALTPAGRSLSDGSAPKSKAKCTRPYKTIWRNK